MSAQKPKAYMPPVPPELATWLTERLQLMEGEMIDISEYRGTDEATWCLVMLDRLSNLEKLSFLMTRLMTKYTVERQLARPATIAKLTDVHQSSVMSRASSETARHAWNEVWPREDPA